MPPVNQNNNPNMGQSWKRGWRLSHPITGRSFKAYSSLWTRSQVAKINAGWTIGLKNVRPWKIAYCTTRMCILHLHRLVTSPPFAMPLGFWCLRFVFLRRLPYRRKHFISRSKPMVWLFTWDWTEEMAGWRDSKPHVDWIEGHAQFHYACIQSMRGHKAIIN